MDAKNKIQNRFGIKVNIKGKFVSQLFANQNCEKAASNLNFEYLIVKYVAMKVKTVKCGCLFEF